MNRLHRFHFLNALLQCEHYTRRARTTEVKTKRWRKLSYLSYRKGEENFYMDELNDSKKSIQEIRNNWRDGNIWKRGRNWWVENEEWMNWWVEIFREIHRKRTLEQNSRYIRPFRASITNNDQGKNKNADHQEIPRCIRLTSDEQVEMDIHLFWDASGKPFTAAAYVRNSKNKVCISSNIIMVKTRVTPKKTISVAKLELQTMGSRMSKILGEELTIPINRRGLWTDSSCVRNWLRMTASDYKPFPQSQNWRYLNSDGSKRVEIRTRASKPHRLNHQVDLDQRADNDRTLDRRTGVPEIIGEMAIISHLNP